jgi:hypothetical protein
MRRLILPPVLFFLAACDSATGPATPPSAGAPTLAAASKAVDPSALKPPPALVGATAECQADGQWIICHTLLDLSDADAPVLDLPCGTVYETASDIRHGIRWYNASDSMLVKRHVRQDVDGTWTLSPSGGGATVSVTAHGRFYDSQYAIPGDVESGVGADQGEFTVSAPGFGVIAHIAGRDATDDPHRGVFVPPEDPAVAAQLCAALTR